MVSIIIPNYNHAGYLKERIDSVLCQTFQDFEIIILDNNSTDDSRKIIETYSNHPRISQIIYNPENNGNTFKQWNNGIALAKGKYIWIAESDDIAEPELLETLVKKLEENNDTVLAFTSSEQIDENDLPVNYNGVIITPNEFDALFQSSFTMPGTDLIREQMYRYNFLSNASAIVFRKDIFIETGWADETKFLLGDWLQWNKMLLKGNVFFYAEKQLNHFRIHTNTNRKRIASKRLLAELLEVQRHLLHNMPRSGKFRNAILDSSCYRMVDFIKQKKKLGISSYLKIFQYLTNFGPKGYFYFIKSLFQ